MQQGRFNTPTVIKDGWSAPKTNWKELRQSVLKQRHQQAPALKTINFYLLLALHLMEPLPVTENAILEMIPHIEMENESLQTLIGHCLNRSYAEAYQRYHENRIAEPEQHFIITWLSALFENMNTAKATKLAQLLPRFQTQLPEATYRELLTSHLLTLRESYPQQAVSLLINAMEGFKTLNLFCYELYFKVLFPFLNPFYHNIIEKRIVELGLILERLCKDNIQWATSTTKQEYVFLHIVGGLLALEDNTLGKKIVAAIHDGHPFQLIFQKHLPILRQMAFPVQSTASNEILPLEFQRMVDAVSQTLKGRDLQRTKKPLFAIFDASFEKSITPHLEKLLNEVLEKGKIALQNGVAGTVSTLFEICSYPKIHDVFPRQCLEIHMELIGYIARLSKPLYVSTNRDFLLTALQMFYSRVPLDRKAEYCHGIAHLTHQIWSPSEPIGFTLLDNLSTCALDIIRALSQSPGICVSFLLQLHIFDVPFRWEKMKIADLIPLVEFALSNPEFSPQQKTGIIKIADNYSKTTSQQFPEHVTYLICQYAIASQSVDSALEWYERLQEVSTNPKLFVQIIPQLLMKLHAIKKFSPIPQLLIQYQEYEGVIENIDFLWTDLFISSQANALIRLIMYFPANTFFKVSTDEGKRQLQTLCQSLNFPSESIMEVQSALLLLIQAKITDHQIWIRILHEVNRIDVAPLKRSAFDILLWEQKESQLLNESPSARAECWQVLIPKLTVDDISEETALKLIKSPNQLNLILLLMGNEVYKSLAPKLIRTLYAKFQNAMNSDVSDDLCAFHAVFFSTPTLEKFFEVDFLLLNCVDKWISDYWYCSIYDNVLFRLQRYPALQTSKTAMLLLHTLATLAINSEFCSKRQIQFIRTVCSIFDNAPWIISFLRVIFCDPRSEHYPLAKELMEDFFSQITIIRQTSNPTYFDEHRQTILMNLTNLVKSKGALISTVHMVSDIVHHPHVSAYLKKEHLTLTSSFIECLFAESASVADDNLEIDVKNKKGYIKLLFFVFEKHIPNMSSACRNLLWKGLLDLVNMMVELHQNYPLACKYIIKILTVFAKDHFYASLEMYLKRIFEKPWALRPETPIQLTYEIINGLITRDAIAAGKDYASIIKFVDLFHFDYDFIGQPKDFGRCLLVYRSLALKLVTQAQNTYFSKLRFELPIHYSFDDTKAPMALLKKYAMSTTIVCHTLTLDMLHTTEHYVWQDPSKAVKIIKYLYQNHLENPFKRYFESYYIRASNDEIAKIVGVTLNMQTPALQSAAEQITTIMITANTKFIQIIQNFPSCHINDLEIYVRMLFCLAKNGAFDSNPHYYWLLACKHLIILNEFTRKNQHFNTKFILYGLMFLDPAIWSKPQTLDFESNSRKLILHQTLIDEPLSRLVDPNEITQVLQTIQEEKWEKIVSVQSELKHVLDTLVAKNKIKSFQRKVTHKISKSHSSKSYFKMHQE